MKQEATKRVIEVLGDPDFDGETTCGWNTEIGEFFLMVKHGGRLVVIIYDKNTLEIKEHKFCDIEKFTKILRAYKRKLDSWNKLWYGVKR